ncbi:MAG: outer membrane protein assembly factor BamB family protein [Candidatus Helarchaeota archaeon]
MKNPYQSGAPWPSMRGNTRNSGCLSELKWKNPGIVPKATHFRTENAIFSTPVLDAEERIFIGSADHKVYAFDPHEGLELWKRDLGEIIDSAACIGEDGTIYVGGGDGKIHAYTPEGTEKWSYDILKNRVKRQFTFSTNYWFEANIVLGPDNALYVANDDFFLYKFSTDGKPIWGFRTGFLIWSAPAFGFDNSVYIAGFDHFLYALDMETGRLRWRTNLKGALVASPAVGEDGTIYQGSFDGKMSAIDGKNGEILWQFNTEAHIYASVAIAPDQMIYFGSTNGIFYALEGKTGKVKWTYYIGDAIRASAAIGPDPENEVPYLIYFGGGDGMVYAIDPNGRIRWRYNTLIRAEQKEYPNINASIALGHNGLTVASSTGDVIWISYDYYQQKDAIGITLGEEPLSERKGVWWHFITPGGKLTRDPLNERIHPLDPTTIISLKLLIHTEKHLIPALLVSKSIQVTVDPTIPFDLEIQSDRNTIHIIPKKILTPKTKYHINIRGTYYNQNKQLIPFNHLLHFETRGSPRAVSVVSETQSAFNIVHMAIPFPRIIPSLDQIGLASLTIPFSIIETNPEKKTFVAWAVHKFGEIGVPQKRVTIYAFAGMAKDDYFLMNSKNCFFEITSFVIPLDHFRLSGRLQADGTIAADSSLFIKKFMGMGLIALLRQMKTENPLTFRSLFEYLRKSGIREFFRSAISFFPALIKQIRVTTWRKWGLINHENQLIGVGTFKLKKIPYEQKVISKKVRIIRFDIDPAGRKIEAEVKVLKSNSEWPITIGILAVNKSTGQPLLLNYNNALKIRHSNGGIQHIILSIPKPLRIDPTHLRAYLMADIYPLKTCEYLKDNKIYDFY